MVSESYKLFNKRLAEFEAEYGLVTPELKKHLKLFYIKGTVDGLILPLLTSNKLKEAANDD